MKISLYCSTNLKAITEILESRGFIIDDNASVSFVERNIPVPVKGIALTFDPVDLNEFIEFLDSFPKTGIDKSRHIIGKKGDSFEIVLTDSIIYLMKNFIRQ